MLLCNTKILNQHRRRYFHHDTSPKINVMFVESCNYFGQLSHAIWCCALSSKNLGDERFVKNFIWDLGSVCCKRTDQLGRITPFLHSTETSNKGGLELSHINAVKYRLK